MKLSSYRRIITQDYGKDDQELIEQLGSTVNDSFNSLYSALNKRLNFTDNIASTLKQIVITVDSNGNLQQSSQFTSDVPNTPVIGVICIRAVNITNPGTYATAQPFVSFSQNGNTIIINNIKGLQPNQQWRLTIVAIN